MIALGAILVGSHAIRLANYDKLKIIYLLMVPTYLCVSRPFPSISIRSIGNAFCKTPRKITNAVTVFG